MVVVGGFLGAGKTTLILSAARVLAARGLRVAAVLNDQGTELVDVELARQHGVTAGAVKGGCFCCRYGDLEEQLGALRDFDVIFAEPVGSCTDLSSTVMRPLLASPYRVAPLTVVVDPVSGCDDENAAFLLRNQVAEADLLVSAKSDLGVSPSWAGARRVSGKTGEGVAEWLDELFAGGIAPGGSPLDLDYDRYTAAELSLSWLDCRATFELTPALSPAAFVGPLLDRLDGELRALHIKAIDRTAGGYVKAAVTGKGSEPQAEGDLSASPARVHELLLNIRGLDSPERMEAAVRAALPPEKQMTLRAFRPGAPVRPARV